MARRRHSKKECLNHISDKENIASQGNDYDQVKLKNVNGIKKGIFSSKNALSDKAMLSYPHNEAKNMSKNSQNLRALSRETSQNRINTYESIDEQYLEKNHRNSSKIHQGSIKRSSLSKNSSKCSLDGFEDESTFRETKNSNPKSKKTKKNMSNLENNLLKQLDSYQALEPIEFNFPEITLNHRNNKPKNVVHFEQEEKDEIENQKSKSVNNANYFKNKC